MPIATTVVFISRKTSSGEMCRRAVVAAHRTRSSKCRLLGNNTRMGLNESPGTGATRLKQSLLATATAAQAPNVHFPLGYSLLQLHLTDTRKREML